MLIAARTAWPLLAAALLLLASLALFWPGVVTFDGVAQYGQAVSGIYDDWHPPAEARLWSVLRPLAPGAIPMLVLQLGLYWAGFAPIAAALWRSAQRGAAAVVLGIALFPPFLGWQGVVLKDAQMVGAMLAAAGLVGGWRLAGRRVPAAGWAGFALLIGYATLVRANAVFASVPLAVMLAPRPRGWPGRIAATVVAALAVLAVSPLINHRLMHAIPTGVERTQALYDLAGIAVRVPAATDTGLTPAEVATIAARHCVTPFFWDPLGDPDHCDATMDRLRDVPVGALYATLVRSIVHHPLAYAAQRLAHLNSTERWLVPAGWVSAGPPSFSQPNTLGLGSPGAAGRAWQRLALLLTETPPAWPIFWVVVAATGAAVLVRGPKTVRGELALALFVSALALEGSFAVLSIASDLRYHLWPMIASALGAVLAAGEIGRARRSALLGAVVLVAVVAGGIVARVALPRPPATYEGMLG